MFGLFIAAGLSLAQEAVAQPRIEALIVDGFSNHDWRKTTAFIDAALTGAGYTDLINAFNGPSAYSFLFSAQLGYLDHALANAALAG
ncbi:MAG: hypothetical protein GY953_22945, partial [bacterium]|nr:hypothetical protein [bacterium]